MSGSSAYSLVGVVGVVSFAYYLIRVVSFAYSLVEVVSFAYSLQLSSVSFSFMTS